MTDLKFIDALQTLLIKTIIESSKIEGANVVAIRPLDTVEALIITAAQMIVMSDFGHSPTSMRRGVDLISKRLRQHTIAAAADPSIQKFRQRYRLEVGHA